MAEMNVTEYGKYAALAAGAVPNMESMYGKRVLITGGGGLICSSIADILFHLNETEGASVHIILAGRDRERMAARFPDRREGDDYEFIQFDSLSGRAPDNTAEFIIHGAGNASPSAYSSDPVGTMHGHIFGTDLMLSLAVRTSAVRLLYISSSEVYGTKDGDMPYKEEDYSYVDITNPRASYPSAKRAAETLCAAYRDQYGIDTVTVRPGHIFGVPTPADDRAFAQFLRCAKSGSNIVMKSAGTQLRSYCYSLDCASAILTVLLNGERGEAYNISDRDSVVTIRDLAETIARLAGVRVVFEDPTDKERKGYNMMKNSSLDAAKLEALGWKACVGLENGLRCCLQQMGAVEE